MKKEKTGKAVEVYNNLPILFQTSLEAIFINAEYSYDLYKYAITVSVTSVMKAGVKSFFPRILLGHYTSALDSVKAIESVPVNLWPHILRYVYCTVNLKDIEQYELLEIPKEFSIGYSTVKALAKRYLSYEPKSGIFEESKKDEEDGENEEDNKYNEKSDDEEVEFEI